jgi:hypothetical protein
MRAVPLQQGGGGGKTHFTLIVLVNVMDCIFEHHAFSVTVYKPEPA